MEKKTTHENTHGNTQENEKVNNTIPSLNAQIEVQNTGPLLPMMEPNHGGNNKKNLGATSGNYDLKPRKSERNIPKKYELKNKSLGEQPGAKVT